MSTTFAPRPTTYNGIEMRSRLEARVAALFDKCGFLWRYEPGAFANKDGQYLPDFVIDDIPLPFTHPYQERRLYVEIKGQLDNDALDALFARMQIILTSQPEAGLAIGIASGIEVGIWWVRAPDGYWRPGCITPCPHCGTYTFAIIVGSKREHMHKAPSSVFFYCWTCRFEVVTADGYAGTLQ